MMAVGIKLSDESPCPRGKRLAMRCANDTFMTLAQEFIGSIVKRPISSGSHLALGDFKHVKSKVDSST